MCFCENPWLVRSNPQTWNTTGNGDWFPITGVRCGSGYVVLGGSSQGGVQKLDLTPVSSGGIAVMVVLQPISDMALDTVLPRINVEVPFERTKSYSDSSVSSPTLKCCLGKKAEQFCWQTIKHINENLKVLCSSFLSGVVDPRYYRRRTRFFASFSSIPHEHFRRCWSAVPTVSNPQMGWITKWKYKKQSNFVFLAIFLILPLMWTWREGSVHLQEPIQYNQVWVHLSLCALHGELSVHSARCLSQRSEFINNSSI